MPTVPMRSPVPIASAPLPGVRVSAEAPESAFGPPRPADLSGVQQHIEQLYLQEQAKANQIAVMDADNRITSLRDSVLYGTPDNPGIINRKGKDALDVAPALDAWQKGKDEIMNSLSNDQQKLALNNRIDGYDHALHLEIQSHVAAERQRYDGEQTNGFVDKAVDDSARFALTNPDLSEQRLAEAKAAIAAYGARNGEAAEQIQQAQSKAVSNARMNALQLLLTTPEQQGGGDLRAAAYLAQHNGDFLPSQLVQAQRLTDAGSVRGESQRQADAIVAKATDMGAALQQVQQIADPQVRDATHQRVLQAYSDQAAVERQKRDQSYRTATQTIVNGGTVNDIPIADKLNLSPTEIDDLVTMSGKIRNPVVQTAPSYYQHWSNMASVSPTTQAAFLAHDFASDRASGKISEQDFHLFTGMQRALRSHDATIERSDVNRQGAAERRQYQKTETAALKAIAAYNKSKAARDQMAANPATANALQFLPPLTTPQIPQALADSAANDEHYMNYLKANGYNPVTMTPTPQVQRQQPKAPGLP